MLNEFLSPEEFQAIESHVAECAACQETLERLNAFTWREWREPDASVHADHGGHGPIGAVAEIPGHEIQEELGRGGHGVVFLAIDRLLDRPVALKMIRQGVLACKKERDRFLTEARTAARIHHRHIIPIYTVGERAGQPYFTMELAAGGSLDQRLADGPIGIREAARLLEQLALAVHHAHERGVLHRDLKPANILLADETLDEPRIADFGIAQTVGSLDGRTPTGQPFGTPGYMAPELVAGGSSRVGLRADIFALGAILYELVTHRPPFRGDSPFETLLQTRELEPAPPSELRPGLPRELEAICLKCLRKRPDQRYGSASELADDLRRFLDGEAVRGVLEEEKKEQEGESVNRRGGHRYARPAAAVATSLLILISVAAWMAPPVSRWGDAPDDEIAQRFREATPAEVPSLQAALRSGGPADSDFLWTLLDEFLANRDPGALAVAAVLVDPAPEDPRWASRARPLADLLVESGEAERTAWSDRLRSLSTALAAALGDRLADNGHGDGEDRAARIRAARLLLDIVSTDAAAASNLSERLQKHMAPLPEENVVEQARRVGNLGSALILAGDDHFTRALLPRSPNPTARAYLIASLGRDRESLDGSLLERAAREPDPGSRQALLLALGRPTTPPDNTIPADGKAAIEELRRFYRDDPDAGVHSAAEWVLIRWNQLPLIRLDRNLLTESPPPDGGGEDRNWRVGLRRHTFAILRPPGERPFAITTSEVSALQLREFLLTHPGYQPTPSRDGLPAHPVPLFMARAYCNWLSLQDGLGDELCYAPGAIDSFQPIEGFLNRRGYRLPTEDEWLFACWGEAATPYPHGLGEELFGSYGRASASVPLNVSQCMPNDHGLFDMLGNASEWCEIPANGSAIARGGSFLLPHHAAPTYRAHPNDDFEAGRTVGFRVARTIHEPRGSSSND